jgi:hypothetical protein
VYGREIEGQVHTFGVSGKLIMNALVMYDHQTRTLWSQFLRKGVKGPLAGVELEFVPVTQTNWSLWRELHPDTLVLDKNGRYQRDSYASYYFDGSAGVIGETIKDNRLGRKELVLGIDVGEKTKAYPLAVLDGDVIINDSVGDRDILVYLDSSTGTALVYDRVVDGRAMSFQPEGEASGANAILVDKETGTRWMAFTGRAIEGELTGAILGRVVSHLSFWFAWTDWNPETELYGASRAPGPS